MKSTLEALTYPLRRENLGVMLLGIAVLSIAYSILSLAGRVLWIELLFLSYYAIFLQSILHVSMEGRDTLPAWPEAQSPEEFLHDFFSIIAPFVVAFLPLLVLHVAEEGLSAFAGPGLIFRFAVPSAAMTAIPAVLLVSGWIYLPMSILVWNFYGGWSIFNPIAVAKAAWRTGPDYLFLVLKMAVLITAAWSVTLIPDRFITTFGASLLTFYALIVSMRLLGTFYRAHRAALGFERELPEPA